MKITKNIIKGILYSVIALMLLNISACKKISSYDYPPSVGNAYDIMTYDANYSIFLYAVTRAGLTDQFTGGTANTLFIPTNAAMTNAGFTQAILQTMTTADITTLVKNHIVAGAVDVTAVSTTQTQTAISGFTINLVKTGSLYYANGGDILAPSQAITGGFMNPITTVLFSRTTLMDQVNYFNLIANSTYSITFAAIARASTGSTNFTALLSGSTPYTFFAPTNAAWVDGGYASAAVVTAANADVIGNILKYHLIAGAKYTTAFDSVGVNAYNAVPIYFDKIPRSKSPTTTFASNFSYFFANGILFGNSLVSNLTAGNGVMHTVPRLLSTSVPITTTTLARISSDATLTMFYALIQRASTADPNYNFAAWLADPLKSYTVYAVNNTGLIAAGYANIAAINAEDPAILAKILKLHMIAKRINNISIVNAGSYNSLLPTSATAFTQLKFGLSGTYATVGGYTVQGPSNSTGVAVIAPTNIITTNGILNIIGGMLTP